jgi:TRAP-type mannitol/chloroaromatic compound transport system substrate-binding protein
VPKIVEEMSGGRFKIEMFPPGAIVPAFQALDSVVNGSVECCNTWGGYYAGKDRAFGAIECIGAGINNWDRLIWYYQHGGKKIADDLFAEFGVMAFMNYVNCAEQGFLTKKPIKNLEDYKGLKLRCANFETRQMLGSIGASVISMPAGEVYEALKRGVIDGLEMGTTYPNLQMGLHEIVEYWSLPIWHQRSCGHWFVVNKKAYDSLPNEYKAMIKYASMASCMLGSTEQEYKSAEGVKKFFEAGVKDIWLDETTTDRIEKEMVNVKEKVAAENENYRKVIESVQEYIDYMSDWRKLTDPYGPCASPLLYKSSEKTMERR